MSAYDVEHNTKDSAAQAAQRRRRPDLSTFFATLSEISPDDSRTRQHAVPVPHDVSAAFYSLAEALEVMRREGSGQAVEPGQQIPIPIQSQAQILNQGSEGGDVLSQMIRTLLQEADTPPKEVEGVSEEFCDGLERVPRSSLKPSQICPICNNPFAEDPYPLVVRLPCHPSHMFDFECVRPWLRLRGTCPLDRVDFGRKEREKAEARKKPPIPDDEEEEEEWDGMYG